MIDPKLFRFASNSISWIVLAGGLLFFVAGLSMLYFNWSSYSKMERAEGTVVKWQKGMKGPGPHVQFEIDGKPYVISGQIEMDGGRGAKRGSKVDVLYDPDDPSVGTLDFFIDKWFTSLMFTGVGFFMALIASVLVLTSRRKQAAVEA